MKPDRVIILDDELEVGEALALSLGPDFEAEVYIDPQRALSAAGEEPAAGIFFCDLNMPGFNGVQVYEALRARGWPVRDRFVFVTGGSLNEASTRFLEESASHVLEKPFRAQDLQELTQRLLRSDLPTT